MTHFILILAYPLKVMHYFKLKIDVFLFHIIEQYIVIHGTNLNLSISFYAIKQPITDRCLVMMIWRHKNVIDSRITQNSTFCLTVCAYNKHGIKDSHHRHFKWDPPPPPTHRLIPSQRINNADSVSLVWHHNDCMDSTHAIHIICLFYLLDLFFTKSFQKTIQHKLRLGKH